MLEEEIFSVGSMAGEEWETFARVEGVAFDAEGNLYILDAQNSRVVKVGPQGQFITTFGRSGEGPGEFTRPLAFSVTRSGEVRVFDLGHQGFTGVQPRWEPQAHRQTPRQQLLHSQRGAHEPAQWQHGGRRKEPREDAGDVLRGRRK